MKSYRQIFRSSAIIGGSSAINIVISIIKVKVLAVLLGPAGVGLMGFYQNIMSMSSTVAGCGLGSSGVRQIAASVGEEVTLAIVRRTLWLANIMLGLTGMAVLWLLREPVAELVFGHAAHVNDVGWLGLGVFLSLIAVSQTTLLRGLRRIGDLAWVNIISSFAGAVAGIFAVYILGEEGVIWFVLTAPAASVLAAMYFVSRLPRPQVPHDWQAIQQQWQAMMKLGIPFMGAALLTLITQLVARSIILHELGIDASGYFQAAWAISMTYVGFVLGAMGADYYPRLTESIKDHQLSRKLVNEQTEMALLLAGPTLLAMLTFAPWVIQLLYTESFTPASDLLRWQMLGDIVKVASWPMGFIIMALGRGGVFLGTQLIWNVVYLGIIVGFVNQWGLLAAGVGFLVAYIVLYGVVYGIASQLIDHATTPRNLIFMLMLILLGGAIVLLTNVSTQLTYAFGATVTLVVGMYSLHRLNNLIDLLGWLRKQFG
ncbi:MAG: O-antigen translocase [Gammaproteobacteria bacterium]|nr:O-antigen translocase [Gammaproteobacteria bacterium]